MARRDLGMYVLLADDTDSTYTSTYDWEPQLHSFQQEGASTLFLTFINPDLLPAVPPAFSSLAKSLAAANSNQTVIFSIGGQAVSENRK